MHFSMVEMLVLLLLAAVCAAMPDSGLVNVSEVIWSGPENRGVYLGSPSIVQCPGGPLLASHDFFGPAIGPDKLARIFSSSDSGITWKLVGQVAPMYWATLFVRDGDTAVYIFGTTNDGNPAPTQIVIARSLDCGATWQPRVLTNSTKSYSTGPTPILQHNGRLWRAFEHNTGPGWGSGYSAVVISAPDTASDLLDPTTWTLSGELAFSAVRPLVPPTWSDPAIISNFGWLESNAVAPVAPGDAGINVVLRVNSLPAANKAALLYVPSPTAAPQLVSFIDFPGGMSKFTIRRHAPSGLYVTLSNLVADPAITIPPHCASGTAPSHVLPACSMAELRTCPDRITCLWAHANSRDNLTLAVSQNLTTWTMLATVMAPDTGDPEWLRQITTGFQYVDWQFDGDDIIAAVRAAYRGADCYHNSNRILFQRLVRWQQLTDAAFE
eukprot:m.242067 g.242067  ORF g.242067 m.242067 type:complete len:439 (+) comp13960_c0_seq1:1-1317(+)